jgi:hypothetical protein
MYFRDKEICIFGFDKPFPRWGIYVTLPQKKWGI